MMKSFEYFTIILFLIAVVNKLMWKVLKSDEFISESDAEWKK